MAGCNTRIQALNVPPLVGSVEVGFSKLDDMKMLPKAAKSTTTTLILQNSRRKDHEARSNQGKLGGED